jgi:protein-S-isoprenylcysteine O-methyltransferase Ste14
MRTRLRWLAGTICFGLAIFVIAGTWTDPWLWTYWCVLGAVGLAGRLAISDELWRERSRPPDPGADARALRVIRLAALAHVVIGALDTGRWQIAPVATELRIVGVAGVIAFAPLLIAAMRTNRFFSAVVRIQHDRGHHVVGSGPYALVRHPGYLAMLVVVPCSALVLGSWLGVGLTLVYAAMLLRRVSFEDAFLQAHLEGYGDYARQVRYRLIPLAW